MPAPAIGAAWSDDNGSTAMSSGASVFDNVASDGISATHGTDHAPTD